MIKYISPETESEKPKEKELPVGTVFQVKPKLQDGDEKILLDFEFEHTNLLGFEKGLPQTDVASVKSMASIPNSSTLALGGFKIIDIEDE